jgi:hypothetical protein
MVQYSGVKMFSALPKEKREKLLQNLDKVTLDMSTSATETQ